MYASKFFEPDLFQDLLQTKKLLVKQGIDQLGKQNN